MIGNYLTLMRRYSPLYAICLFTELISRRILFGVYNCIFKLLGVSHVIVTLFNEKKMILEVNDRGLSHDLLFDYKKHREPYASSLIINYFKDRRKKECGCRTFIDVGSNLGYYSILLSDYFDKIIAVEPVISSYNICIKNAQLNEYYFKTYFYNMAITPTSGYVNVGNQQCKNLVKVGEVSQDATNECIGITIGELCDKNFITNADFMKMDVEGYEHDIIVKGESVFSKYKPKVFFLEIHFDILGKEKSKEVLETLIRNKYKIMYAVSETKVKTNWLGHFSGLYEKFVQRFIMDNKYGVLYENCSLNEIINNKDIMNAKQGAMEFILVQE